MSDSLGPVTSVSLLIGVRDPKASEAWSVFLARYGPMIWHWCRSCGLQDADAQDISQEILAKLVQEMRTFEYRTDGSFRKWLKTVTRNAVRDFWRKRRRSLLVGTGDSNVNELLKNAEDSTESLVELLTRQFEDELLQEAERAVEARVSVQSWAVYCARQSGESARDIAHRMNMGVAAVHKAKSRVSQLIRDTLHDMVNPVMHNPVT